MEEFKKGEDIDVSTYLMDDDDWTWHKGKYMGVYNEEQDTHLVRLDTGLTGVTHREYIRKRTFIGGPNATFKNNG